MNNPTQTPDATSPLSTPSGSPWSRRAAWAAPPAFAIVVLLHRNDPTDPMDLAGSTSTWIWIHVVLLGALVLLAHAVRTLLHGLDGPAAGIARALLPIALVTYAAFDSLVGLGTGVLVEHAESLGPDAERLAQHWWTVPAPISWIAAAAQMLWVTVIAATAFAHSAHGNSRALVAALAGLAVTFPLLHARPVGLVPVALLAAALWLHRSHPGTGTGGETPRTQPRTAAVTSPSDNMTRATPSEQPVRFTKKLLRFPTPRHTSADAPFSGAGSGIDAVARLNR
jgi:hypothetical protein